MPQHDITYTDNVGLITLKGKKILVVLKNDTSTWFIPTYKRSDGERYKQTLSRGVMSQLNLTVKDDIALYGIFEGPAHNKNPEDVIIMTCYIAKTTGKIKPNPEISEAAYFSYKDKEKVGKVDQEIFDQLHNKKLLS